MAIFHNNNDSQIVKELSPDLKSIESL